ncbi:MAG: hypothetical protein L3J96_05360, partial [Thermoplasmata archaeon]|nr:hypothetical protein [Thermoplasmata archaeon]
MASTTPAAGPPRAFPERRRGGAVVLVLVLLTISAVPVAGSGDVHATATIAHPPSGRAVASTPTPGLRAGLDGASGLGRFIDGPALYRSEGSFPGFSPPTNGTNPTVRTAVPSSGPTSGHPPLDRASRPSTPGGWVSGTVADSVYGTPV